MNKLMNGNNLNLKYLWKLIRGGNLLFIVLIQYFFKYLILDSLINEKMVFFSGATLASQRILFFLMVLSTVFIAAAGYIINDISDVRADKINKPGENIIGEIISLNLAKTLYYSFNVLGILLGFFCFYFLGKPTLISVQLLMVMLLYLYAVEYQCKSFWGNVMVAFAASMVVLIVWLFEFYMLLIAKSTYLLSDNFSILLIVGFAGFAFLFTLLREWSKDLQDFDGDSAVGCRNLMIKIGMKKGNLMLAIALIISSILIIVWQILLFLNTNSHLLFTSIYFVLQVLIYTFLLPLILKANGKNDYHKISNGLKLIMAAGMLFMIFFRI
ncbi:MAG: hypothetical protein AUJ98_01845 [Bacteroidetes bacterium CG2_30_33_31]|nr:MAG: hypothetical protein AUJ98_01845 [Bacteroidetes bacterium CG2_30_33_31]